MEQVYTTARANLIGDGSSLTATIVLDSTPICSDTNIKNFSDVPDSVSLVEIRDELGNSVPASAVLTKSGKQVLITFSAPFTGRVTVTFDLGFNVA